MLGALRIWLSFMAGYTKLTLGVGVPDIPPRNADSRQSKPDFFMHRLVELA